MSCLAVLSFFYSGEPPNKNAAKPSGNKGVREPLRELSLP
jgi:hypothetical protein